MSKRFVVALAAACGLALLAGCTFDSGGPPPFGRNVAIPMAVLRCSVKAPPPPVSLEDPTPGQFPQVKNYKPVLLEGTLTLYALYIEGDVAIQLDDKLKGAVLVKTSMADAGITAPQFLRVRVSGAYRAFYVAYDARAKTKPAWLTNEYTPEIDPVTHALSYITTTLIDTSPANSGQVRLELWRRKPGFDPNNIVIPGNSSGSPDWGSVPANNRAMYVVLIAPEQQQDCTHAEKLQTDWWRECVTATQAEDVQVVFDKGKADALQWCASQHPGLKCEITEVLGSQGDKYPWIGSWRSDCMTIYGSTLIQTKPHGFSVDSEIEFVPAKSRATVALQGQQYTTAVNGKLFFDYLFETHEIRLNDMHLQLDPLSTDVGTFKEITSTLAVVATAHCQDAHPVPDQPCSLYRVPQGQFATGQTYDLDGTASFIGTANDNPIDITIDHPTRTFQISGGPLATNLDIGGKTVPVALSLDLTGYFVNFAPIAVGRESTKYRECTENSNALPVFLNASGSFDVYDTLPANPTTYQWYEDYGLVTEKLWGQQKKVTIAPHQLAFRIHKFTLVVRDKDGVAGTDTRLVTVGDKTPPNFKAPPDVLILQPASAVGAQQVDIGKPLGGSDACSMKATITNDAPPGLVFQPGVTLVTWAADDHRGNRVTQVQKVSLLQAQPLLKADFKKHFSALAKITGQFEAGLRACGGLDECPLDLSTLHTTLEELAGLSRAEPGLQGRQRIVSTLDRALLTVADLERTLAESNANPARRARLRDQAIRRAAALTALLQREAR